MNKPNTNWKYWPSEQENEAIAQQLSQHIFPISDMDAQHTGTCIPIRIGDRYFLATAAHVLNTSNRLEIVPRDGTKRPIFQFKNKVVDNTADLGLLELQRSDAARCLSSFLCEDQILVGLSTRRTLPVAVIGYPSDFIKQMSRQHISADQYLRHLAFNSFTYKGRSLHTSKWPTSYYERPPRRGRDIFIHLNPGPEIMLSHPKRAGIGPLKTKGDIPCLKGISGGGIWLLEIKTEGIWHSHSRLIGIQVDAKQDENWLRGTLIDRWLALVDANYPALRPAVVKIRQNKI